MGLLSASEILAADDWPQEHVTCPEWGGSVRLRAMSEADHRKFNETYWNEDGTVKDEFKESSKIVAAWVLWSAVDENNNRIFTQEQLDDLSNKYEAPLLRCCLAARRVNGAGLQEESKN